MQKQEEAKECSEHGPATRSAAFELAAQPRYPPNVAVPRADLKTDWRSAVTLNTASTGSSAGSELASSRLGCAVPPQRAEPGLLLAAPTDQRALAVRFAWPVFSRVVHIQHFFDACARYFGAPQPSRSRSVAMWCV
jgi:hypothetical protein